MKIFILFCNILIPLIMITIGILYRRCLYKRINRILDLFIPIAMIGSGVGDESKCSFSNNTNIIISANKKCSIIWSISGICTLIVTIVVLILNKPNIVDATTFLDINNISVIMLEIELAIAVAVFVSVEYISKRKLYKKADKKS